MAGHLSSFIVILLGTVEQRANGKFKCQIQFELPRCHLYYLKPFSLSISASGIQSLSTISSSTGTQSVESWPSSEKW